MHHLVRGRNYASWVSCELFRDPGSLGNSSWCVTPDYNTQQLLIYSLHRLESVPRDNPKRGTRVLAKEDRQENKKSEWLQFSLKASHFYFGQFFLPKTCFLVPWRVRVRRPIVYVTGAKIRSRILRVCLGLTSNSWKKNNYTVARDPLNKNQEIVDCISCLNAARGATLSTRVWSATIKSAWSIWCSWVAGWHWQSFSCAHVEIPIVQAFFLCGDGSFFRELCRLANKSIRIEQGPLCFRSWNSEGHWTRLWRNRVG